MFVFVDFFHGNLQVPLENERCVFSCWRSFILRLFQIFSRRKIIEKTVRKSNNDYVCMGFTKWPDSQQDCTLLTLSMKWFSHHDGAPAGWLWCLLRHTCPLLFWTALIVSCHPLRTCHSALLVVSSEILLLLCPVISSHCRFFYSPLSSLPSFFYPFAHVWKWPSFCMGFSGWLLIQRTFKHCFKRDIIYLEVRWNCMA